MGLKVDNSQGMAYSRERFNQNTHQLKALNQELDT